MALDIGTQYVKAAQFRVSPHENTVSVWGLGLNKQRNAAVENGIIRYTDRAAQVAENTIIEANHLDSYENTSMLIGMSGPYVQEHITTVWHRRTKSHKKIKQKEWDDILEDFREQARRNTPEVKDGMKLAHSSLISTSIDKSRVSDVLGQTGQYLEAQIFRGYCPSEHLDALADIAEKVDISLQGVASESFAGAQLVSSHYPNADFIFIDVGGTTTTVSRIEDGLIQDITHFSIGGLSFTRRIAQELEVSLTEAESIKVQYSMARLSKKVSHKLAEMLKEDIRIWLEGVEVSLKSLAQNQRDILPPVILIHGGGANLIGVKEALNFDRWYQNLPFEKKPTVGIFHPDNIPYIQDNTGNASDALYTNVLGLGHVSRSFSES